MNNQEEIRSTGFIRLVGRTTCEERTALNREDNIAYAQTQYATDTERTRYIAEAMEGEDSDIILSLDDSERLTPIFGEEWFKKFGSTPTVSKKRVLK